MSFTELWTTEFQMSFSGFTIIKLTTEDTPHEQITLEF